MNHALADCLGNCCTKNKCGDEIPERGPEYSFTRRKNACGDDGGDGIGGIVPAVREIKRQSDSHDNDDKLEAAHASGSAFAESRLFNECRAIFTRFSG